MSTAALDHFKKTEEVTAHVLWITSGLSCEGDSVAMTSATNPSLEDIITQAIPGMPKVVVHTYIWSAWPRSTTLVSPLTISTPAVRAA